MIKQFIPKEYRSLLDYISPAAFKVVDWKKAMAQFLELSKHALNKSYIEDLAQSNVELFSPRVQLRQTEVADLSDAGPLADSQVAEFILDTYFSQFFSNKGTLLDLRLKHFVNTKGHLLFDPGAFVHRFEQKFRTGMLEIYQGYYLSDPQKMENGMLAVGLVKKPDPEKIEYTKKLLFSHFGEADQGPIEFNLEHFKQSFQELFLHLKKENIRLSSDFLFLGIYLVTLYLALSKIGQKVDVKKCFIDSWERNSS
jgi:predicted unusual protein kinase regulating ubiquinone biosynthesis (AarF/ABC1/UbiB family)